MYVYVYVCVYIYIYIEREIHIYIYIYILSASRKPSGRFLMVSVVDTIQRLFMVSVVGTLMVSVVAGNVFQWFPFAVFFYGFRRGKKTSFL